MAFPTVAATNSSTSASTSSHSVSLPASISAGDLLVIGLYLETDGGGVPSFTTPSGWTLVVTAVNDGADRAFALFYKVASGSEGASVTVTTSSNASGAHVSQRITGYSGTPEAATAASAGAPNPPSLTPSWGAQDTLWVAWGGDQNDAADLTAPTNYASIVQAFESVNSQNSLGAATRNLNATSDNPGTFGGSTAGATSLSATVAIKPTAAATAATKTKYYKQRRAA